MNRYHMTAYYEDRTACGQVAQEMIVLAENPRTAVSAARDALRPLASGGHIAAIQFGETAPIAPGVVHVGDPFSPLHWPLINRVLPRRGIPGARSQPDSIPQRHGRGGAPEAVANEAMVAP